MNNLWTDKTAKEATHGETHDTWQAARVEIDSRRIQRGDLFVALKGERFDGHVFINDVMAKDAAAVMIGHAPKDKVMPAVIVRDTLKGLQALGSYARKRSQGQVIGLTGSVGKTSTKEMLRLALGAHGDVFASHGNYNNHIGVPLNLANLPPDTPYAVFEMGMNHAQEISLLTRMVQPRIAIITNIEAVHLEFFKSVEDIADAKAEIFESKPEIAILNADNAQFERLKKAAKGQGVKTIIACGESKAADCRLLDYHANACGSSVKASIGGKEITYALAAIGRHWAMTSLLALAAVHALKLDVAKSAAALAAFSEPEGRGKTTHVRIDSGEIMLIDDSYNASPASMRAAFAKTAEVWETAGSKGRKIAVLGDMLELGKEAQALHLRLAEDLKRHAFDAVFTAGRLTEQLQELLPASMRGGHAENAKALLPLVVKALRSGDIVLVKGSHGSKMYELAEALSPQSGDSRALRGPVKLKNGV